jgi:hypothetical protein
MTGRLFVPDRAQQFRCSNPKRGFTRRRRLERRGTWPTTSPVFGRTPPAPGFTPGVKAVGPFPVSPGNNSNIARPGGHSAPNPGLIFLEFSRIHDTSVGAGAFPRRFASCPGPTPFGTAPDRPRDPESPAIRPHAPTPGPTPRPNPSGGTVGSQGTPRISQSSHEAALRASHPGRGGAGGRGGVTDEDAGRGRRDKRRRRGREGQERR